MHKQNTSDICLHPAKTGAYPQFLTSKSIQRQPRNMAEKIGEFGSVILFDILFREYCHIGGDLLFGSLGLCGGYNYFVHWDIFIENTVISVILRKQICWKKEYKEEY